MAVSEETGRSAFAEEEPIPLSYLSQYGYCPRRCGLIAVGGLWNENQYTAEGRSEHARAHTPRVEKRGPLISLFEYAVFSRTLGLSGLCDCVELHASPDGVKTSYGDDAYTVYPVEYKHGVVRDEHEYHLQLCAQAMCLEEQFHTVIPKGAVFYIDAHRRDEIDLTDALRAEVTTLSAQIRTMIQSGTIPSARASAKCRKCSMAELCRPELKQKAGPYLRALWQTAAETEASAETEDSSQ